MYMSSATPRIRHLFVLPFASVVTARCRALEQAYNVAHYRFKRRSRHTPATFCEVATVVFGRFNLDRALCDLCKKCMLVRENLQPA